MINVPNTHAVVPESELANELRLRYFPAAPPVHAAVQEKPRFLIPRSSLPKIMQHNTFIKPPSHCNRKQWTGHPPPPPPAPQLIYLIDAIIFLLSRWFSKTQKHHPTCAITPSVQQRSVFPFHTFPPPPLPTPRCPLFWLCCVPVLNTEAV